MNTDKENELWEQRRRAKQKRDDILFKIGFTLIVAVIALIPTWVLLIFFWAAGPVEGTAIGIMAGAGMIAFGWPQILFLTIGIFFVGWLWING